jgi:hypothetical protein
VSNKTDSAIFLLIFLFCCDIMILRKEVRNAMQGNKSVQTHYASILQKGYFVGAGIGIAKSPAPR